MSEWTIKYSISCDTDLGTIEIEMVLKPSNLVKLNTAEYEKMERVMKKTVKEQGMRYEGNLKLKLELEYNET